MDYGTRPLYSKYDLIAEIGMKADRFKIPVVEKSEEYPDRILILSSGSHPFAFELNDFVPNLGIFPNLEREF